MNARHSMFPNLRAALEKTAARVTALLVAFAAAATLAGAAGATVRPSYDVRTDFWADGNLVDVQIRVDGEAAPLYVKPRTDLRHYFQAFAGRNYSVVLRNNTGRRIGVLLSLSVATSIDALITGVSFGFIRVNIFIASALITLVTFLVTAAGAGLAGKADFIPPRWAEFLGGCVLVGIGSKVVLEHVWWA